MIGKVTGVFWDQPCEVELTDDGQLQTNLPETGDRLVRQWYEQYQDRYSPSDGFFGVDFLYELAEKLDGKVELGPPPPMDPDAVY